MVTSDRMIENKYYSFYADGTFKAKDVTDYIGRYVDFFTIGHGSERGNRVEIERISDGCIWASLYLKDYGGSAYTKKGRIEGVKLENGVASGPYKRAWVEPGEGDTVKTVVETGTFQIRLKNPSECSYETIGNIHAYSPIAVSQYGLDGQGVSDDFYFYEDEWEGQITYWYMESEGDLF